MILSQQTHTSPHSLLLQASMGQYLGKAIATVIQLNIADRLTEGPKSAEELAQATGMHGPSLYRLLRFLSSLDVFAQDKQGYFSLTPLSDALRKNNPESPRDWVEFNAQPWRWELVQAMTDVIATGKSSYEHIYKKDVYSVFSENPEFGLAFNQAMKGWSASLPAAVVRAYDFSKAKTVVDIGGGMGALLGAILKACPHARGILFDQPHVVPDAKKSIEHQGVADRCEVAGGDFLTAVPEGGDLYIISYVLMDWSNEDCIKILKNCHHAMTSGSKLLIVEPVIGSREHQTLAHFVDLIMLLETSGRARDEAEWRSLLQASSFSPTNLIHTDALSMDLIEIVRTEDCIPNLLDRAKMANQTRDRAQPISEVKPLGTYLVEAGLLTPDQVNLALNEQQDTPQRFGEVLSSKGWVRQETIEYMMEKVILPERQLSGTGMTN